VPTIVAPKKDLSLRCRSKYNRSEAVVRVDAVITSMRVQLAERFGAKLAR
jgi:hypothetical protein